jgi:hypothetical protein
MNKIRLNLDRLSVDSFATAAAPEARGTVDAAWARTNTGACATCGGATCFTSCSPGGDIACTCPIA